MADRQWWDGYEYVHETGETEYFTGEAFLAQDQPAAGGDTDILCELGQVEVSGLQATITEGSQLPIGTLALLGCGR